MVYLFSIVVASSVVGWIVIVSLLLSGRWV